MKKLLFMMAVAMAVVSCKKDDKVVGKDKDGKETEIAIGSLDELDNDDLIELREAYGYKVSEDKDDYEDDYDDYSCGYKSKFD